MIRLILIAVVVFLSLVAGSAIALYHFYSWKGWIALPVVILLLVWIAKKLIGLAFRRFALGLFTMKSKALRGATLVVHSITPVAKPEFPEDSEEESAESDDSEEESEEDDAEMEPEEPKEYFAIDMTITPQTSEWESVWEPSELMLSSEKVSSMIDLHDESKQIGSTEAVAIWNGTEFGDDDPGKYPGPKRLRVTFGVKPGTSRASINYYAEALGEVELPRGAMRA